MPHSANRRLAGYAFLVERFHVDVMPHDRRSVIASVSKHEESIQDNIIEAIYPNNYWPGDTDIEHLVFALKYDGFNLGILYVLFLNINQTELLDYITATPTGKYARYIWFFYEFLTGNQLPLDNLITGNYTEILDAKKYITVTPGDRVQRQRLINNLLGNENFCPIVRRTEKLKKMGSIDFRARAEKIIAAYPPSTIRRALVFLYTKETKLSFEIEKVKPDRLRMEKFIALLARAEEEDFCEKRKLIALQNQIVDPRFTDTDYRKTQNYIGQTINYQRELVHYISPPPRDLIGLMSGLIASHHKMKAANFSPVIHAAIVAYAFVFMHPFEDGNGRIHRFLIHNILSCQGMIPEGLMFPISATMLKDMKAYDASLEHYSKPLMKLIEYSLDEDGKMAVHNDVAHWYRYIDMTCQAEILYDFVSMTIENELMTEFDFLEGYDRTKAALQEIVDLPDRLVDLFIRFCFQNAGKISARKRAMYFDFLTDDELRCMEEAVSLGYRKIMNE